MEKIKNKYIFLEFLKIFIISSIGFLFLFFIIQILEILPQILKSNQNINLKTYFFQSPKIFVQVSPIITFFTILFLLSEMLKYNEIKVLEITGISPFKVYRIFLTIGFIITGIVFLINNNIVPVCLNKIYSFKIINKINFSSPDIFIYSDKFIFPNSFENFQSSVSLSDKKLMVIKGKNANYSDGKWKIYNGKYWILSSKGFIEKEKLFSYISIKIPIEPDTIWKSTQPPDFMSLSDLKKLINKLKQLNLSPTNFKVGLQEKVAYPFLNFFIILASIPFFLLKEKFSRFFVISFSSFFSFFCYILYSTGISMANHRKVPILIGVWMVHIFILFITVVFFFKLQTTKKSDIIKHRKL